MPLTRERKIFASFLLAAIAALAADRLFLASPQTQPGTASAGQGEYVSVGAVLQQSAAHVQNALPAKPAAVLAERLTSVAQAHQLHPGCAKNAFAVPPDWTGAGALVSDEQSAAANFVRDHRLEGLMVTGDGGHAVVDGRCYWIGQKLDRFTLVAVGDRVAVWRFNDVQVELTMKGPADSLNQPK